jgi:hypothetical protein
MTYAADTIKATRSALRKVPQGFRGASHQMASRYAKDAAMWLKRGNIEMANEKAYDAKLQCDRAVALCVWA